MTYTIPKSTNESKCITAPQPNNDCKQFNLAKSLDKYTVQQTALLQQLKTATLFFSVKLKTFTLSFQQNPLTFCFQSFHFQLLFI